MAGNRDDDFDLDDFIHSAERAARREIDGVRKHAKGAITAGVAGVAAKAARPVVGVVDGAFGFLDELLGSFGRPGADADILDAEVVDEGESK